MNLHDLKTAIAFTVLGLLCGCASLVPQTMLLRSDWPAGVAQRNEITDAPFFPQLDYQCGPAALATTLTHAGLPAMPEELVNLVYLPARQGSLQADMLAAARRRGAVSYKLQPRFDDLLREVAAGNPVVVLQDTGIGPITNWHYAVVVGFDYAAGELYLRSGATRREALPFTIFEYTWKKSGYWAMVTMAPGRLPATADDSLYPSAIAAMARVAAPEATMAAWGAALERWPGNIPAATGLANLHYARGELPEAARVLRRGVTQHPDSVVLLNNLAQVLSDLGDNVEALALIERAGQPGDARHASAVRETHALILQRSGNQ